MTSLGFIASSSNLAPPPPNLIFCSGPPNYFGLKFLAPPKIKGVCYHEISSVAHHNLHINAIFLPFYAGTLRWKNPLLQVSFTGDKPWLQLKIITSSRSTLQTSLTAWMFSSVWGNAIKEGETPICWEQIQRLTNLSSMLEFLIP